MNPLSQLLQFLNSPQSRLVAGVSAASQLLACLDPCWHNGCVRGDAFIIIQEFLSEKMSRKILEEASKQRREEERAGLQKSRWVQWMGGGGGGGGC